MFGRARPLINVADAARAARRRLPRPIADYLDGGADDEAAVRGNVAAFGRWGLVPDVLTDISAIDTGATLFGRPAAFPLMLSPTGLTRMFHDAAEPAVARAAAAAGLPYALSTMGTTRIEDVPTGGVRLFQVYIFKDRSLTREWVARAKAAGYDGLIVTVDTPVAGNRERDVRNGLSLPPRLTLASALEFARHPGWAMGALNGSRFNFANVAHHDDTLGEGAMSLFDYIARQFDPTITWRDLEWLRTLWDGPLAIKGVMNAADARRAVDSGADTVILSNHGGRQLGGAVSPLDMIEPVRAAIGASASILCDGGVRRGADIVKAVALGADGCSIGRPYLWALAAGGEAGVARILGLLHDDVRRTMTLLGTASISAIERRHLARLA